MSNFLKSKFFRTYLPGFVFQSVVIAGGYGTGQELIEYFLSMARLEESRYGCYNSGLGYSLAVTMTLCVYSRLMITGVFTQLLGNSGFSMKYAISSYFSYVSRCWFSRGNGCPRTFGIPYGIGVTVMLLGVAYYSYSGSKAIEAFMSWWSFILYGVYVLFVVFGLSKLGPRIAEALSIKEIIPGWGLDGFRYAFYNLGCICAILFTLTDIETRSEAYVSGFLGSLITIIPGFLFYMVVLSGYPEIVGDALPAFTALKNLGSTFLLIAYQVVLFGTLIETGTGFIHAVN